jgi:hypothetical protein
VDLVGREPLRPEVDGHGPGRHTQHGRGDGEERQVVPRDDAEDSRQRDLQRQRGGGDQESSQVDGHAFLKSAVTSRGRTGRIRQAALPWRRFRSA